MTKKFCDKCKEECRVYKGSFILNSQNFPSIDSAYELCGHCLIDFGKGLGDYFSKEIEKYLNYTK